MCFYFLRRRKRRRLGMQIVRQVAVIVLVEVIVNTFVVSKLIKTTFN